MSKLKILLPILSIIFYAASLYVTWDLSVICSGLTSFDVNWDGDEPSQTINSQMDKQSNGPAADEEFRWLFWSEVADTRISWNETSTSVNRYEVFGDTSLLFPSVGDISLDLDSCAVSKTVFEALSDQNDPSYPTIGIDGREYKIVQVIDDDRNFVITSSDTYTNLQVLTTDERDHEGFIVTDQELKNSWGLEVTARSYKTLVWLVSRIIILYAVILLVYLGLISRKAILTAETSKMVRAIIVTGIFVCLCLLASYGYSLTLPYFKLFYPSDWSDVQQWANMLSAQYLTAVKLCTYPYSLVDYPYVVEAVISGLLSLTAILLEVASIKLFFGVVIEKLGISHVISRAEKRI